MLKHKLLIFAAAACAALPLSAGAVLDTYPDGPTAYTNGFLEQAQTFLVGPNNVLTSFQVQMFNAPGQAFQLEIFAWGGSGPTGAALYTSPSTARINATQDFLFSGINLTLTQGSLYGAVIDNLNSYSGQDAAFNTNQVSYSGGSMWLRSSDPPQAWSNFSSDNLLFKATFDTTVPVGPGSSAPEPAAYALMAGGLGALGLLRRRFGKIG